MNDQVNPRAALDAAIDAARLAQPAMQMPDGRHLAFVPEGYSLQDISDPLRISPRVRHVVRLDDRVSTTAYINRFGDERSVLIADFDTSTISAVLDFHHGNVEATDGVPLPGPCEHRADFKLLPSEEFTRWDAMEGQLHSQAVFAEFLDENSCDIALPEAATMVEIARDLEASTDAAFRSAVSPESGDRKFTYETETKTKGDVIIPKQFTLNIPLYNGEGPEMLNARFRFRATPEGLQLGFVWHRVEYQRRAFFTAIATQIAEDTGRPVFAGRGVSPTVLPRE